MAPILGSGCRFYVCLQEAKTVFKHKIIMIRCLSLGCECFLKLKECGRQCQKWIINNPLPPRSFPLLRLWPHVSLSHLARSQKAFNEQFCFLSCTHPGFPGSKDALSPPPPSLLACEQNDGSLESQDMAENRKVSLAHQKGVFRGNYPLRRKGPEPEVLQRRT